MKAAITIGLVFISFIGTALRAESRGNHFISNGAPSHFSRPIGPSGVNARVDIGVLGKIIGIRMNDRTEFRFIRSLDNKLFRIDTGRLKDKSLLSKFLNIERNYTDLEFTGDTWVDMSDSSFGVNNPPVPPPPGPGPIPAGPSVIVTGEATSKILERAMDLAEQQMLKNAKMACLKLSKKFVGEPIPSKDKFKPSCEGFGPIDRRGTLKGECSGKYFCQR